MSFSGKYILAAIDGTSSHEWRNSDGSNSHVFKFHRDIELQGGISWYWNGPGEQTGGVVFGRGSTGIVESAVSHIRRKIIAYTGIRSRRPFSELSSTDRALLREEIQDQVRIVLVGHSRGGLIAINVAARLPLPVHFLGLYDAVDRHPGLSADRIHNVDHTAHALRHPDVGSRPSFGNCGRSSSGQYDERFFRTSHGGVGGDPVLEPTEGDYACDIHSAKAGIMSMAGVDLGVQCTNESYAANAWIREKARNQGIRF